MSEPASKGAVLVADDHEANRDLLAGLLIGEGYQVICAEDGERALEIGGGRCPEKENGPTPLGRLSSVRRPGRAALNLTWRGSYETQATTKGLQRQLPH